MGENMVGKEILDDIIIGRVEPHIYAFSTNTVPNYLKIGDTYRPVSTRLNEWKRFYPNLKEEYKEKAIINTDVFFRDYAVHKYVEEDIGRKRLKENELSKGVYYSNEFFENATNEDIKEAIKDIKRSYSKNDDKYQFYDAKTSLPETFQYRREENEWKPRPNQEEAVKNFVKARRKGRNNLLMYAVMRFGKSFTSMLCAKEMDARLVVVVSAKADVKIEWKKTVEIPKNFEGYEFISSSELEENNNEITDRLKNKKRVVVFLTLQDLQGELIKEKHKDIFKNKIDLLLVDETHFGARAEQYGKLLLATKYVKDINDKHSKEYDLIEDAEQEIKAFDVDTTIHLSGTPYRILMGSEFEKDDIISFCQFSDIVEEQEKWNNENVLKDNVKEWDNPYFGFPQMVRFAFNPSKKAVEKLKEYQKNGHTYAFSALLMPKSIKKDTQRGFHKKFVNEKEILELFEVIDGSQEDENVLGFLNYDKIKNGNMCRHIVCVLPYCASCDALEALIKKNKNKFKNLKNYEIINISGVDNPNKYRTVKDITNKIKECEENNKKTLTLTVNRMLTGSTVEQWDTMIYLKDTSSPQEYDQAIFRLQNQYVKNYTDKDGNIIKYNMKPQTILVDFDPLRMFRLQEQKSKIYNVNIDDAGNSLLEQRLKNELKISPIITINKNRIVEVNAKNIMDTVSEYSKNRGIIDEVNEIPADLRLLDNDKIRAIINSQAELGSRQGLIVDNSDEENGDDLDVPNGNPSNNNHNETSNDDNETNTDENASFEKKIRTYYARMLFYSFLTKDIVISLSQIIESISKKTENKRIAKNIGLNYEALKWINKNIDAFVLSQLDYKIQHINRTSHDETLGYMERAEIAMKKFDKLSPSEYITSSKACKDIVGMISVSEYEKIVKNNGKILDMSSKMGEFTLAIWEYIIKNGKIKSEQLKNVFYSISTSSVAYEFTRKIYECLGLNIDNIATKFNAYKILDFVGEDNKLDVDEIKRFILQNKKFCDIELEDNIFYVKGDDKMKFDVVVGNPPYQMSDGGAQASAKPIYQYFVKLSNELAKQYSSLIIPSRWYVGGKGLDDFRKDMLNDNHIKELHDCLTPEDIFPNTNIRGGVCYFLRDDKYDNKEDLVKVVTHEDNSVINEAQRPMKLEDFEIFIRDSKAINIIKEITTYKDFESFSNIVSSRKPFGLEGNYIKSNRFHNKKEKLKEPIVCYGKAKAKGFIEKADIVINNDWINKWKVFMPYANNIGTELNDDNLNAFVGEPNSVCTETFLVVGVEKNLNKNSTAYVCKYLKTKFVRFLISIVKTSQHATSKVYKFVPLQDFTSNSKIDWSKSIHDIDLQLYKMYKLTKDEKEYIENRIKDM